MFQVKQQYCEITNQNNIEIWGSKGKIFVERAFTSGPDHFPKVIIENQSEAYTAEGKLIDSESFSPSIERTKTSTLSPTEYNLLGSETCPQSNSDK